jgi:hypothetical protein
MSWWARLVISAPKPAKTVMRMHVQGAPAWLAEVMAGER